MVIIYGKSACSSCEQSKAVLSSRNIEFEYKQLDKDYTMEDLMEELDRLGMVGFRSFPLLVQEDKGYMFMNIGQIV